MKLNIQITVLVRTFWLCPFSVCHLNSIKKNQLNKKSLLLSVLQMDIFVLLFCLDTSKNKKKLYCCRLAISFCLTEFIVPFFPVTNGLQNFKPVILFYVCTHVYTSHSIFMKTENILQLSVALIYYYVFALYKTNIFLLFTMQNIKHLTWNFVHKFCTYIVHCIAAEILCSNRYGVVDSRKSKSSIRSHFSGLGFLIDIIQQNITKFLKITKKFGIGSIYVTYK